jgi:phosphopantetheinyl transferase (holo-ACP synthase)
MNQRKQLIRSILVSLDIEEVQRNRDALLDTHFSPEERAELAARHIRSTAGRLALKRAVLGLLPDRPQLTEKDIVLKRLPNCPPLLVSVLDPPGNLFLSISHTRNTAYGLAVLQEQ